MHTARCLRCLRRIVVAGEVNIVLDEYSEVFSAPQECRPEREERESVTSGTKSPWDQQVWLCAFD